MLWYYSNWLPKNGFDIDRLKSLFLFGSRLLIARLIDAIYKNIYLITIGKLFSVATLAAFVGTYTGSKFLKQVTMKTVRQLVGSMLILIGLALTVGLI